MDGNERGSVRLVDYIVVIAFDESQIRHGNSVGSIVQRLPKYDWPDISLSPNLEVFSQPQGWSLSTEVKPPTFFFNTLTDILGSRQYAYCLQLQEPCGSVTEEDFDDLTLNGTLLLYKPKVIVILSRFPFFELFRNCLNRLHLAILDSECNAETMAATLLSSVHLSVGASAITFNVAAERLIVRAPLSLKVPVTADKVTLFVEQMGTIQNILTLLVAIMTDRKVLFRSSSLTRLADSCYAICALLYPFEYPHTFVPVLPEILTEYLESPTPYIMGLLNSIRNGLNVDLDTTIIVDLDIGAIHIPNTVVLPTLPEPYAQRFINSLQMVLNPSLVSADDAWKMGQPPHPSREVQDKRIRACFIRFFAELLAGYRCCLEVVRIHTPPLIVFHKSAFLGLKSFSNSLLIRSFLDSLLFQSFICERGLPYRICDLFDDLVSQSVDILFTSGTSDPQSKTNVAESITEIAEKLQENEHQDSSFSMTPLLTHKRFVMSANVPTKLHPFDEKLVTRLIEEKQKKMSTSGTMCGTKMLSGTVVLPSSCASAVGQSGVASISNNSYVRARKVPTTTSWLVNMNEERHAAVSRRLQVLGSCLRYIFDMKLSDARKMLCAVELSMRSVNARVALCQLLWMNLSPVNRATLLPQQFELIVRLINCALKQESKEDEHGIAYAMLYLSNIYCRRLTAGVHQFVYTCIQEHDVWENEQFWEAAFFHDVHRQLRRLYMPVKDDASDCPFSVYENVSDTWNLMEEPSGMDLVSERIEKASKYDESELKRFAAEENSIVFGQAKHYINLMVYLRIPLDVSKLRRVNVRELERISDRNATRRNVKYSDVGSDIIGISAIGGGAVINDMIVSESGEESDVESGFIESDDGDLGNVTVKWIRRLIDRICSSVGLEHSQIERLCDEIPGFVALHIDNLEQVYTESKRLSPMHKPKLLQPALLLPAERILIGGMRVFLLNDGRMTIATNTQGVYSTDASTQQSLLPAEGAIFLTNYRVIFKGQPCDPFLCEQVVVRTIAIMSITKEKQIADQSLLNNTPQLDGIPLRIAHQLHDAFQIRTCNAQLMKVAFDEEVSSEKADEFIETLLSLRWPSQLPHTLFAYSQTASLLNSTLVATNNKHKYGTIRELKKTLLIRNPLKEKKRVTASSNRSQFNKLLLGTYTMNGSSNNNSNNNNSNAIFHDSINTLPTTSFSANASPATARNNCSDYLDLSDAIDTATNQIHRHYLLDYDRLGLTHRAFRLSNMNHKYELSKSYPSVLVVPSSISDESFTKINKGFKHGRFPVVVWKNNSEALLIRGASLTSQTMVARLKKQANLLGAVGGGGGGGVGTASDTHSYSSSIIGGSTGSRISLNSRSDFFNTSSPPNTVEMQERYMSTLVALSPHTSSVDGNLLLSESLESLLSLNSMITIDASSLGSATPDNARKPYSQSNSTAPSCSIQTSSGIGSSSTYASDSIRYVGNYVRSNNVTAKTTAMRSLGTARAAAAITNGGGGSEYLMSNSHQQLLTRRANTFLPSSSSSSAQTCNSSTSSCNVKNRPLISLTRNSMYIFGDRNQAKMMKLEKDCEFVPITYPSAHNVKIAFKKFLRAMCPSWTQPENDHSNTFLKLLDDSNWLQMISSLLNVSNAIVDLIDVQHSSVCLCIEDGWDATCQISSLSQILLDPFYRTIDGLRVLIEKEWLAFGHRFSHRANHSVASQNSGIAPMFLMFLDALHQIHEQYPSAFEFSDFFLRFLAYHSSSAHFRTFLLDSECERLAFDSLCCAPSTINSSNNDDFTTSLTSIWNYINQKRKSSPIFVNFCYAPQFYTGVLRSQSSIASLTVWSFFAEDYLAHGTPYDLEVAELEEQEREDEQFECTSITEMQHSKGLSLSSRRLLDATYREMELLHLDSFSTNLNNYCRIGALLPPSGEDEKSAASESCQSIMHSVDTIISSTSPASISFTLHDFNTKQPKPLAMITQWRSHLQRAVHKKETLKLLLRGISTHQTNAVTTSSTRMRDNSITNGSSIGHHRFVSQHVTVGDTCAVCHQNVPGVIVRNVHRCMGCGMICHEKCSQLVSSVCSSSTQSTSLVQDEKQRRSITPKAADPSQTTSAATALSKQSSTDGLNGEDSKTLTMSMSRYHPHTNATHCGFLMKKGATFKMWKPRWFVLDSTRHQIRYYENETDLNCRGIIELADIKAVDTSCSHALRKPLIEIRTVRRIYSLLAETKNDADAWTEKILGALRE